jgi:hypothetical protein
VGIYPRSSIAHGCAFHPCAIEDPRGRATVRASPGVAARSILIRPPIVAERTLRALRANRDFGTDMKRIRTKITVMDKSNNGFGSLLSKTAAARLTRGAIQVAAYSWTIP